MALIPPERLTTWTPSTYTGVPGGIIERTGTVNVTGLVADSESDATANSTIIQAAIASAVDEDGIEIPAGTYFYDGLSTGTKSNITIRGSGMGNTILIAKLGGGTFTGSQSDYDWAYPASGNIDTSGAIVAGDDTVTISDTSPFVVNTLIAVCVENMQDNTRIEAGEVPIWQARPLDAYVRKHMAIVTAKDSSTVTFFPPLPFDAIDLDVKLLAFRFTGRMVGIEDMTIDMRQSDSSGVQHAMLFEQCYGCWIKNVEVIESHNYAFSFSNSLRCEVRGSFGNKRSPGGSNGSGVLMNLVGSTLIEDNIIYRFNPGIEVNLSSTCNVIAYNLFEDPRPTAGINTNHNPHNSFNLYEGNISPNTQCDGYYGGASEDTHYRNWYTGFNKGDGIEGSPYEDDQQTFMLGFNRFTRNYSVAGNVFGNSGTSGTTPYSLGNPNIGNSSFTGEAQPTDGDFWRDWKATAELTTRTNDTSGVLTLNGGVVFETAFYVAPSIRYNGTLWFLADGPVQSGTSLPFTITGGVLPAQGVTVELFTGENGFQEQDRDTFWVDDPSFPGSTILRVNYHNWAGGGNAIPAGQALGADPFPSSLAYGEVEPDWWPSGFPWPPVDPLDPVTELSQETLEAMLPAAYRFYNGEGPSTGSLTCTTLNVTTLTLG